MTPRRLACRRPAPPGSARRAAQNGRMEFTPPPASTRRRMPSMAEAVRRRRGPAALAAATALTVAFASGCATRAADVAPAATDPAEFASWACPRLAAELDRVQQQAADVAYAVDERVGNNLIALGVGVGLFWPALLAMRPDGLEAADLARLKGRYEALHLTVRAKGCPPPSLELDAERASRLAIAAGEWITYEQRAGGARSAPSTLRLRVQALRRDEIELSPYASPSRAPWRQDAAGNLQPTAEGALAWPRLLRREPALGQVFAGEILVTGDPFTRARVRAQVIATGEQVVAGRRFDAAVLELYGDAIRGDASTRLDGAIVVDRATGLLLRLDLRSAEPVFNVQRRLVRIDPAG
jgi:hypothetical protein